MLNSTDRHRSCNQVNLRCFDWNQTYDVACYRELMLSYSGTQMMSGSQQTNLLDDVGDLLRTRFDGSVTRPLVAALTTAVLR